MSGTEPRTRKPIAEKRGSRRADQATTASAPDGCLARSASLDMSSPGEQHERPHAVVHIPSSLRLVASDDTLGLNSSVQTPPFLGSRPLPPRLLSASCQGFLVHTPQMAFSRRTSLFPSGFLRRPTKRRRIRNLERLRSRTSRGCVRAFERKDCR